MKCDALNSKHYWIKNGKQLCRVIKAKFTNLQLENTIGEYAEIDMIWGYPHIIELGMYNTLMVVEKRFETVKDLIPIVNYVADNADYSQPIPVFNSNVPTLKRSA